MSAWIFPYIFGYVYGIIGGLLIGSLRWRKRADISAHIYDMSDAD